VKTVRASTVKGVILDLTPLEVFMPTSRKPRKSTLIHKPSRSRAASSKRQPARRATLNEEHIGAMEEQMVATMPPSEDDDEPKQG